MFLEVIEILDAKQGIVGRGAEAHIFAIENELYAQVALNMTVERNVPSCQSG